MNGFIFLINCRKTDDWQKQWTFNRQILTTHWAERIQVAMFMFNRDVILFFLSLCRLPITKFSLCIRKARKKVRITFATVYYENPYWNWHTNTRFISETTYVLQFQSKNKCLAKQNHKKKSTWYFWGNFLPLSNCEDFSPKKQQHSSHQKFRLRNEVIFNCLRCVSLPRSTWA